MGLDARYLGRKYGPLTYEVGKEKIKEYARAIKNEDPHYLDEDFAKNTRYGGIIAPPTFAVVYAGMLAEPFFHDKELNLNLFMLVHGEQAFEFCDVVRAGDVITSRGEIIHIENKETLDVVTLLGESVNQAGTMVCKAVFTFVIRK